jgi:hypothetical protein
VPNVEPDAYARNIEVVSFFDCRLVGVPFYLDRVEHAIGLIDEMHVVRSQGAFPQVLGRGSLGASAMLSALLSG